jgi:hypothetical protein
MENVPVYEGRGYNNGIMNVESRGDPHRHLLIERIEDTIRGSYQTLLHKSDIYIDPPFGIEIRYFDQDNRGQNEGVARVTEHGARPHTETARAFQKPDDRMRV